MTFKAGTSDAKIFLTAEEDIGKRLDQFLAENTDLSRAFCQKLITGGEVCVDSQKVEKVAFILKENQGIQVLIPEPKEIQVLPEKIVLDILYEDDDVVVVNKSAGMVVHPDDTYSSGTLVNALLGYLGTENLSGIGGMKRPGIVHRLDRDTSGVLIVAKHDKAHRHLSEEIAQRRTTKIYTTLVFGRIKHTELSIDSPIERDATDRKRMSIAHTKSARMALTHVKLKKVFANPLCSLLGVQIITGRTHQIRVHLSSIGYPVVGDPLYGNEKLNEKFQKDFPLPRIFLHAESLTITLPNGKEEEFVAPLSLDIQKVLEMLHY